MLKLSTYCRPYFELFRVVLCFQEPPFVFKDNTPASFGNSSVQYSGYCIELFEVVVSQLNKYRSELGLQSIQYRLYDVTNYGSFIDDRWTGAVGELVYGVGFFLDIFIRAFSFSFVCEN